MNDPQRQPMLLSRAVSGGREVPMDEDEQALGWECANPLLQIERWLQDAEAAAALPSSNS